LIGVVLRLFVELSLPVQPIKHSDESKHNKDVIEYIAYDFEEAESPGQKITDAVEKI
jgi:hypothetical protein